MNEEIKWNPPESLPMITYVARHQTSDGKLFESLDSSKHHQTDILRADFANMRLEAGDNIASILEEVGMNVPDDILRLVNKDSKMTISHWQCRDTPGYQPRLFDHNMHIYTAGNAGSWSGAYGNWITVKELAEYAKDERSILEPTQTP